MWSGCEGFGVWWGFGILHMLVLWGVVIGAFVLLVRAIRFRPHALGMPSPPESALDVLKKRYAAGEIKREEFEQMRRDIQG
jgi:putative membrane protein